MFGLKTLKKTNFLSLHYNRECAIKRIENLALGYWISIAQPDAAKIPVNGYDILVESVVGKRRFVIGLMIKFQDELIHFIPTIQGRFVGRW